MIQYKDIDIYKKASAILHDSYGEKSNFRPGQYEAIEAAVKNKRTIVVQKTGWGKSLVYFIVAKLLRDKGITIVISPLLVLMDNQIDAAERIGLDCLVLNSRKTKEEREQILEDLKEEKCDLFFTTPETLYSEDMQKIISQLRISFFVVDECHCISDWGHDFRLEYGKLNKIIARLPENVSVLGTTATANNRVIEDLKKQFGSNVYVSRGPLMRESLCIQILRIETRAERYIWLKKNINKIPGSGIIYCSTKRDCDRLSDFLNENGISTRSYHSGKDEETNYETEKMFYKNEIKAIVATIKLGMGYDKKDIGFVIHFQRPSSLVAYYQQIGRAGRTEGMKAYCYLMTGKEDRDISEYFIENAFPTKEQEEKVVYALENSSSGLSSRDLQRISNISSKALNRAIMFLLNQNVIYQESGSSRYNRSANPYLYKGNYYEEIREVKKKELDEMDDFVECKSCLSRFVVNSLNDNTSKDCGHCANCTKKDILDNIELPSEEEVLILQEYLGGLYFEIEPRKKWGDKDNPFDSNTVITDCNEIGLALSKYNDTGFGEMVAFDKYHSEAFRKELVDKSVSVIKERIGEQGYSIVSNIPSARNSKVEIFAREVAKELGYEYRDLLNVTGNGKQQKTMQNSYFQYKNAVDKIMINEESNIPQGANIILIDDLVDSKWTLTVAGGWLKKYGAGKVFPFCLADSSQGEG